MKKNYYNVSECRKLIDVCENANKNFKSILYESVDDDSDEDEENDEDDKDKDDDEDDDAVPYTRKDQLMSDIIDTTKQQFGADYDKIKSPMLYYPKDGDVTLSGEIRDINGAKFQFRYKDSNGNGCYVWINPIQLTDETIKKLSVILGVYKNWKQSLSTAEDIKPMGYKNEDE